MKAPMMALLCGAVALMMANLASAGWYQPPPSGESSVYLLALAFACFFLESETAVHVQRPGL